MNCFIDCKSILYTRRPESDKSGMCTIFAEAKQTFHRIDNESAGHHFIVVVAAISIKKKSLFIVTGQRKKSSSILIKASLGVDEDIITLTMAIITMNERILKGRMMWQCSRESTKSTRLLKVIISELWWFRKGHQLRFPPFFLFDFGRGSLSAHLSTLIQTTKIFSAQLS